MAARSGSTDRAFGAPTAGRSGGLRPTSTSPTATRCRVRCWSGCSPASPLAATAARKSPFGSEVEQQARSTSKSSVSRTFIERTRVALSELLSRRLDDGRLAVMMIDGLDLRDRTNVVALGITTEGVKIPLGLWEASTENASVATALLADLVERGLDPEQGILFVIDGAKALRKAIRTVFGDAPVQRCVRHKSRSKATMTCAVTQKQPMPRRRRPLSSSLLTSRRIAATDPPQAGDPRLARVRGSPATAVALHAKRDTVVTPFAAMTVQPLARRASVSRRMP